jgi:hypothetical protein
MEGTLRRRLAARARAARALVVALAALTGCPEPSGPSGGVPSPDPAETATAPPSGALGDAAVPALESPFPLPALTADGCWSPVHEVVVPVVPEVRLGPTLDREVGERWEPFPREPRKGEPSQVDAFPEVEDLLDGLDVAWRVEDGAVHCHGADGEAALRVLAAATAALGRTYRVEVVAARLAAGSGAPDAESVLALRGDQVLARCDRVVRDGALLVLDHREDASFPATVATTTATAAPQPAAFRLGGSLSVSPARLDADRAVLRIALAHTRLLDSVRIPGDDVERVAPALAHVALAVEAPAPEGAALALVAPGPTGETSLAVAWRVTTVAAPSAPAGTLGLSLHLDRPLLALPALPGLGLLDLLGDEEPVSPRELRRPEPPEQGTASLRVVAARPGVVVATGADPDLRRDAGAVEHARRARLGAARLDVAGVSLPLLTARGAVLVQLQLDPCAVGAEVEVGTHVAVAAVRTQWLVSGRTLRAVPVPGGLRVEAQSSSSSAVARGRVVLPRRDGWDHRAPAEALDSFSLELSTSATALVRGDSAGAALLEDLPRW